MTPRLPTLFGQTNPQGLDAAQCDTYLEVVASQGHVGQFEMGIPKLAAYSKWFEVVTTAVHWHRKL